MTGGDASTTLNVDADTPQNIGFDGFDGGTAGTVIDADTDTDTPATVSVAPNPYVVPGAAVFEPTCAVVVPPDGFDTGDEPDKFAVRFKVAAYGPKPADDPTT